MSYNSHLHDTSCSDVDDLIAHRASGESLEPSTQSGLDHHLENCEECRELAGTLNGLSVFSGMPADKGLASLMNGADEFFNQKRRIRRTVALVSVGIAAAAVLLILLNATGTPMPDTPGPVCAPEAAVGLADGVQLTQCPGTVAEYAVFGTEVTRIVLTQGFVALSVDPDREKPRPVVVATSLGEVRVKGTVFSVQHIGEDVRVEVFRGRVEIRPAEKAAKPFNVTAGYGAYLSQGNSFELTDNQWGEVLQEVLAQPRPGAETATNESAAATASRENNDVADDLRDEDSDRKSRESQGARRRTAPSKSSVATLLQEAQMFLIASDWEAAAQKYRQIQRSYPKSQEAVHALISLARIELKRLGHPDKALRYFKKYRARSPKGPLTQEAHLGIAECYRQLGNPAEEAMELREFLKRYPESPSAQKAQNRLKLLSTVN